MKKNIPIKIENLSRILKILSFILISLIVFLVKVPTAVAHDPHDVVSQVAISPTYHQDKTVFIIVRRNLFKSTNGGLSWQRIVKGLDNQVNLSSLAVAPQTKKTLFVLSPEDGVYKSEDEGNSWFKVNNGFKSLSLNLISVSPHSPDLVFAAGTEKGLYKTQNGGQSWEQIIDDEERIKITAIAFSPALKDEIILGDDRGIVYISNNEGNSWKPVFTIKNSGAITSIAISPNFSSDSTFWVGTEKGGIFKTSDRGISFTEVNKGLSDKSIKDLLISQNKDKKSTLFASTWQEGIFHSNDGATTWNKYSQGLTKHPQADQFKESHFSDLSISNTFEQDKTIFLGGFNGLFKSTDGGRHWSEIDTLSRAIVGLAVSPDYKNDSTVAIVTYLGEAYISHDKGSTWMAMNQGLELPRFTRSFKEPYQDPRRFFDIAFSPNYRLDKTIFTTLLWTKFLTYTDQNKYWQIVSLKRTARSLTIAVSPNFASDNTIYLLSQEGIIFKSTDHGKNFSSVGKVTRQKYNDSPFLVISPDFSADKTLFASGSKGVYKTVDGGVTWKCMTNNTPLIERSNIKLAISPNYKVDRTVIASTDEGLFITKNGGESWVKLEGVAYGGDSYLEGIAISPNYQNDRTFFVSARGKGLFKTEDNGNTFNQVGDNSISLALLNNFEGSSLPIKISPSYSTDKTIYGFGSSVTEIFRLIDGGKSWKTIKIPRAKVFELYEKKQYGLLGYINLAFYVYSSFFLRFVAALIVALSSYFLVGYLGLQRKLPFTKLQIKAVGAFAVFAIVFILLQML
jgi:photosystem II stability/assembly factor-like uncharacterized protein